MANQIIPLTIAPNQSFTVQLTVDGRALTLSLALSYSEMAGCWQMAVTDVTGRLLVGSVPLLTGLYPGANVLGQYGYLKIGSAYLLNTGNSSTDYPIANNLGLFSLLWGDTV